jgi:hypothetical protein
MNTETTANYVRHLCTADLIRWLDQHPRLHASRREITFKIIEQHCIDGDNFLDYTLEQWVNLVGMPCGISAALVKIAQEVLERSPNPNSLDAVLNELRAPSSYSKHRGKGSWAEVKFDNIVCHRYENSAPSVPLTLLCPILARFSHNMTCVRVTEDDCVWAMNLLETMCGSFQTESDRENAFHNWFYNTFGLALTKVEYDGSKNAGCITFIDSPLLSIILEVKNEKGEGGGDPYMQGIGYYMKQLKHFKVYNSGELPNFQAQCLLLELCGNSFGISGIVNLPDQIVCEPLTI